MIYATMCVGEYWIEKFKNNINNFSKKNNIHILTDDTSKFQSCTCYQYTRNVFSYYEKIKFILDLSKKYNQRITYLDADWIHGYNTENEFDESTLYSYNVIGLSDKTTIPRWYTDFEIKMRNGLLLKQIDYEGVIREYIPEALISLPVHKDIDDMIKDSKVLQSFLETYYSTHAKTHPRLNRYKKYGIGYAEGWGISALCIKYNIPTSKKIAWKWKNII